MEVENIEIEDEAGRIAREIDGLKASLAASRVVADAWKQNCFDLQKETDRLRTALMEVAEILNKEHGGEDK